MAFTEATVNAQLAADGSNCVITNYQVGSTTTDIYVQNDNINTSRKSGWTQVVNTRTAAQAAADIRSNLTAL